MSTNANTTQGPKVQGLLGPRKQLPRSMDGMTSMQADLLEYLATVQSICDICVLSLGTIS